MNDSHEQPEQETVSTDEDASKSTPSPTPPGDSAPTNLMCSFCDGNTKQINLAITLTETPEDTCNTA